MGPDPDMMSELPDDGPGVAGRSKECDAAALMAAKELKQSRDFKVVPEDMQGGSTGEEPAGNR